jgi:hypothetical protein
LVFLWPAYVGFGGVDQGFMPEMVVNDALIGAGSFTGASFANASKSRLWNYGAWFANRYKNATNIIWVHGGDYGDKADKGGVFTPAQKAAVGDLFAGMKSVANQRSVLHTAHWSRDSLATDIDFPAGAFDLESAYADGASAEWTQKGYAHTPAAPTFMIEGLYELARGTDPDRRFQWSAMLGGIGGYFFGNENLWPFEPGWTATLNSPGAQDMARLNAFVRSLPWYALVPSGLGGSKTLVTAGGGTVSPQSDDYVAAAGTPDGSWLVAYVPPAHRGTFSIDMSALSGTAHARWFNPTNAVYTEGGSGLANAGARSFIPPSSNGSSFNDWVLTLHVEPVVGAPVPLPGTTTWGSGLLFAFLGLCSARRARRRG